MEKPILPIVACVLQEDLSYALRNGDVLYMDVVTYKTGYESVAQQLTESELQALRGRGLYEFVISGNRERKYIINPELQEIARYLFNIPSERLHEFDYQLY